LLLGRRLRDEDVLQLLQLRRALGRGELVAGGQFLRELKPARLVRRRRLLLLGCASGFGSRCVSAYARWAPG